MNTVSASVERLGYLLVEHSLDAIFLTAPDGRIFSANPAACELFGYTEAEFIAGGRALISDAHDPEVAALIVARKKHGSVRGEQWMQCKNGNRVRVEVTSAVFETDGDQRTAIIVRDLSQREHYQYLRRITEAAAYDLPLAFCLADEQWRLLWINPATEQITGYPKHELLGKPTPLRHYLEENDPEKLAAIKKALKEQGKWSGDVFARRRSGEVYPLHGTITVVDSPQPSQHHLVATLADISALRSYEDRLRKASLYDPVTGLPNRSLFDQQTHEMLEHAGTARAALLLIDIDRFRTINESYGHETADQVLAQVAQRLRAAAPGHITVARHTGDSFTLLIPDPGGLDGIIRIALQIKETLHQPLEVDGTHFALTASIGIASYPANGDTPGGLLQAAESALRWVKERGGDHHAFYEPGDEEASRHFIELAAPMREGLVQGEFVAYFQPIVDSRSRRIVSMETLARWTRADGTLISPADFIPIAERSGMIDDITDTLLRQSCQHLRQLDASGYRGLTTAVNLSARQFRDPGLPRRLLQVIADEQVTPNRIVLEITESLLMDGPQAKSVILQTLQDRGMHVVIDDFGTGYSSFAYLKHFHVNGIKLDRVFVQDVPGQSKDEALVNMMLAVGKELDIPVVAEGVETTAQAKFLHERGCSRIQGYLIAPALPSSEFLEFLKHHPWA
ncbi:MAG TPA: EAL domain-containing protein [Gammaproteobacteria bacterium]|nr:EAL domain-containing protein [Gammaproteobacteria bacterium]